MQEDHLLAELIALRAEVRDLRCMVTALEATQEQDVCRLALDIALDRQRISKLEQKAVGSSTASARGSKTLARITKIDEIIKARGPTTLKELERILGIDRATMTRLLSGLDMRRYELHSRPGDDREKVLRLKVQIR